MADSLRTWYIYREHATLKLYNCKYSEIGTCQILWFNRLICSKSKKYFFYETWYDKNVLGISDLLNPPIPGHKLFEELILDFDIPRTDRRKFNFLLKNIPNEWVEDTVLYNLDIHDSLVTTLNAAKKVPKHAYKVLNVPHLPEKRYEYWNSQITVPDCITWEKVHKANFTCTIDDTRLRSFYFKIFHKTIALNTFFYIKSKEKIHIIVHFVKKRKRQWFICFVIVRRLSQFGDMY